MDGSACTSAIRTVATNMCDVAWIVDFSTCVNVYRRVCTGRHLHVYYAPLRTCVPPVSMRNRGGNTASDVFATSDAAAAAAADAAATSCSTSLKPSSACTS
eukprot:GHVU01118478.1.p1 GENE.GHVU01118478.1~~GHVU01118478.1.p1  ORF type:complete len:101 (-),score=6.57 GHVU01118478.1:40-342(-)